MGGIWFASTTQIQGATSTCAGNRNTVADSWKWWTWTPSASSKSTFLPTVNASHLLGVGSLTTKDIVNQDLCSNSANGVKLSTLVSSKKMLTCFTCPRTTSLGSMTCNRARFTKEEVFNQPWLKRSLLAADFFFFVTRRSDDSF